MGLADDIINDKYNKKKKKKIKINNRVIKILKIEKKMKKLF